LPSLLIKVLTFNEHEERASFYPYISGILPHNIRFIIHISTDTSYSGTMPDKMYLKVLYKKLRANQKVNKIKIFFLNSTVYIFFSFLFFYNLAQCIEIENDRTIQTSHNLQKEQENTSGNIHGTIQAADSYVNKKNVDLNDSKNDDDDWCLLNCLCCLCICLLDCFGKSEM
jgi:hypothetical protein